MAATAVPAIPAGALTAVNSVGSALQSVCTEGTVIGALTAVGFAVAYYSFMFCLWLRRRQQLMQLAEERAKNAAKVQEAAAALQFKSAAS
jgi:uncharacterized membrane protein YciS (DUF1049 family)